ncbi:unnamed protein product [Polarella glacialis]|uniref:Uncharacterized protein n=2 Tax=Polarella glacialis TaxID=89957 RepID=A0A813G313_POLGL|nr:unnamed protein product [Polarella glacialis]
MALRIEASAGEQAKKNGPHPGSPRDKEPLLEQQATGSAGEGSAEDEESNAGGCCWSSPQQVRPAPAPAPSIDLKWPASSAEKTSQQQAADKDMEHESMLSYWKKSSGLHTVSQWCHNYAEHPAGWGALLLIHGVPEVTGRLRSKVENYALYAALFLSACTSAVVSPPAVIAECSGTLGCEVRKRIFFFSLTLAVISHVLCIFLAMSFVNALNEAARDSDVIRMFAHGQGFVATVKCQTAFFVGTVLTLVAIFTVLYSHLGYEVLALVSCAVPVAAKIHHDTTSLLFQTGSVVDYWRKASGGAFRGEDDPYDLSVPLACIEQRAQDARDLVYPQNPKEVFDAKSVAKSDLPSEALGAGARFSRPVTQQQQHYQQQQHLYERAPVAHGVRAGLF